MDDPVFNAQQEILCDCGHTYKVSAIGLTEETLLTCPACNDSYNLDSEVIDKIEEEFIEMVEWMFVDKDSDPPDPAVIRFMRLHNRVPSEAEIRDMMKRGEFDR